MTQKLIYPGGPCTCRAGRYVRYVIPKVPGCRPEIHCRDSEAPKEGLATHPIPLDAVLLIRVGGIS